MNTDNHIVKLESVTKRYNAQTVVDGITLSIEKGEFFSLLGPSGCGKTTLLRMIAGFMKPDAGVIRLGGFDVTNVPPYRRDVNTVFQSYALFEHLTVAQNVAFGLKRKKVPKEEIRSRVSDMLDLVGMSGKANARPKELSGGQRQRVALGRSLVNMPSLLLLDEPLGALDLKLRRHMQVELKRIQREVGVTFIYVTHDQEEALTMSDRVAVMNGGNFEQIGNPGTMYDAPETAFVANFIGSSNLLEGIVQSGTVVLDSGFTVASDTKRAAGDRVTVSVRPEKIMVGPECQVDTRFEARVAEVVYMGSTTQYRVDCGNDLVLNVSESNRPGYNTRHEVGDQVTVGWQTADSVILPAGGNLFPAESPTIPLAIH